MTKKIRSGLVALILAMSWLAASGAWAWTDETTVESLVAGSRTLLLEDNITVRASDQTEIRDSNGVRIDFSEIPAPIDVAPAVVMVKVEGVLSGNTVQATKITVRPLLTQ
ncbi:MAG: hypothetical protein JRG95_20155 [Deltaproteobacteria bacterium]|nr:hypothetical protein [Deltaproteobacteria bacterium]